MALAGRSRSRGLSPVLAAAAAALALLFLSPGEGRAGSYVAGTCGGLALGAALSAECNATLAQGAQRVAAYYDLNGCANTNEVVVGSQLFYARPGGGALVAAAPFAFTPVVSSATVLLSGHCYGRLDYDVRGQDAVTFRFVRVGTSARTLTVWLSDDSEPASVGVTGTVAVTGPLTDAQLRAAPVGVSGVVGVSGPVAVTGPLTDAQLRAPPGGG